MADSYRLSLGGTTLDLGSYVMADPGPDFDPGAVLKSQFAENPYADGGQFVLEDSTTRTFKFPMRIASSSAFTGGVDGLEQLLRALARPGAAIVLQPEGTATVNAPQFDVLAGRVDLPDYSIFKQRIARRDLTLELSVSPYGYLPTLIVLASAASIGLPGSLVVPGASLLGDVPALAEIVVSPTSPTSYPLGTWALDTLAWSLGGRPSFQSFWPAASLASAIAGSLIGDLFAPGSQAVGVFPSPTLGAWTNVAYMDVPAVLEPAYRGRFRAFAFAKLPNYSGIPWSVALDAVPVAGAQAALASGGQVASLAPELRGQVSFMAAASPAYTLLDLGDVTLPPVGSGGAQPVRLRLWTDTAGTQVGIASPQMRIGGLYLLPLDGAAGVFPRGLAQPSVAPIGSAGRLALSAVSGEAFVDAPTAGLSSHNPMAGGGLYYRGPLPRLGASNVALQLLGANRRMGAHSALLDEAQSYNLLAYYRLTESISTAMTPFPGYGPTGFATNIGVNNPGPLWGGPSHGAVRFTGNNDSWAVASGVGAPSTVSLFILHKRSSAVSSSLWIAGIGSSPQGFGAYWDSNFLKAVYGGAVTTGPAVSTPDASYHSVGLSIDGGASPITKLYYDASLVATHQGGSWGGATSNLYVGGQRGFGGTWNLPGFESEVMVFSGELTPSQFARLHQAAFSPTGGATTPMVRASEAFAAVSVSYRPRFAFLRAV